MVQQPQNLMIDADECVVSTESSRMIVAMQQIRPQPVVEGKKIIRFPVKESDRDQSVPSVASYSRYADVAEASFDNDCRESLDNETRYRARTQAYLASREQEANPLVAGRWEPILDQFIQINKPLLHAFIFNDIEISHGAMLTLAHNAASLKEGGNHPATGPTLGR